MSVMASTIKGWFTRGVDGAAALPVRLGGRGYF